MYICHRILLAVADSIQINNQHSKTKYCELIQVKHILHTGIPNVLLSKNFRFAILIFRNLCPLYEKNLEN